jgi:hypothetical protein
MLTHSSRSGHSALLREDIRTERMMSRRVLGFVLELDYAPGDGPAFLYHSYFENLGLGVPTDRYRQGPISYFVWGRGYLTSRRQRILRFDEF